MYITRRFWLKYGNENDELMCTTKEWDCWEDALTYVQRYQYGNKYQSSEIENAETGNLIYEQYAGVGETLYDADGNEVAAYDLMDKHTNYEAHKETLKEIENLSSLEDAKKFLNRYRQRNTNIERLVAAAYFDKCQDLKIIEKKRKQNLQKYLPDK